MTTQSRGELHIQSMKLVGGSRLDYTLTPKSNVVGMYAGSTRGIVPNVIDLVMCMCS